MHSRNKEFLSNECRALLEYASYLKGRNGLVGLTADCDNIVSFLGNSFAVDLSNIIPSQLWSRMMSGNSYDGVCYNTALIASGILSLKDFSQFNTSIDYFAGMIKPNIRFTNNVALIEMGPISDFNIVKSRRAWEVTAQNRNDVIGSVKSHVKEHFTPGSILCREVGPLATTNEILGEKSRLKVLASSMGISSIESQISDIATVESSGAHCLVLMTPQTIIESNYGTNIQIRSLDETLKDLTQFLGSSGNEKPNSYFYLEIDQVQAAHLAKLIDGAERNQLYGQVIRELRHFHNFYEELGTHFKFMGYDSESLKREELRLALRKYHLEHTKHFLEDPKIKTFLDFIHSPNKSDLDLIVGIPFYRPILSILEMLSDRYERVVRDL